MWKWLVRDWQWPAAVLFAAFFLLAVLPPLAFADGLALSLIFAQLPLYMLHQWEEHRGDRFRRYMNKVLAGGREALTPRGTFWINALGVWGVDLGALYAAWMYGPTAGLAAGYLALVNGIAHVIQAIALREYNPGLISAVLFLIPGGGWCIWEAGEGATIWAHALGLGVAIAVHGLIIGYVARRLKTLRKSGSQAKTPAEVALPV